MTVKLRIDTYEGRAKIPTLTHTFYGATEQSIRDLVDAHMRTDSFFRAAMTTGNFQGILLRSESHWTHRYTG